MLSPEDEITITIKKIVSRFRQCRIANADLIKLITHHVSCMFVFYICIQFAESITHKTFARTFSQVPVFRFDFQNLHTDVRRAECRNSFNRCFQRLDFAIFKKT